MKSIHKGINTSYVAKLYYDKVAPEKEYSSNQACRQLAQDKHIDKKLLRKIVDKVCSEAKKGL